MARMKIKTSNAYAFKLSKLEKNTGGMIKRAIYEGAKIITDAIHRSIKELPEEKGRWLKKGEKYNGIPKSLKRGLLGGLGISEMERDGRGDLNVKVGVAGYIRRATSKKYPSGMPIPMLARSLESGSSVRQKTPFVRPAVNASRRLAKDAMAASIDESIPKIMK